MNVASADLLRNQLLDRRERLHNVITEVGTAEDLVRLLQEVDSALNRMDQQVFGKCKVCQEDVDEDLLEIHPMIQYCLCDLTPERQAALERDLDLAARIQWALLPKQNLRYKSWETHFRYEPAGPVSGDYCDLISRKAAPDGLFFLVGDVSGKGVAAAFLMATLNAMFRSLIETGLSVPDLVVKANRHFAESKISSHYATLVCGRAADTGEIELCNAGHCPPLLIRGNSVTPISSTGFPVGMFPENLYATHRLTLSPGDTLFLYSDGLTEARTSDDAEYRTERLARVLQQNASQTPAGLAAACLRDLSSFLSGASRADDLTILVIRRTT